MMVPCILGVGAVHCYYLFFFLCVCLEALVTWLAGSAGLQFCLLLLASPYLSLDSSGHVKNGNGVIRD